MSEYPRNKKNNTFTWLSSLYNPLEEIFVKSLFNPDKSTLKFLLADHITNFNLFFSRSFSRYIGAFDFVSYFCHSGNSQSVSLGLLLRITSVLFGRRILILF